MFLLLLCILALTLARQHRKARAILAAVLAIALVSIPTAVFAAEGPVAPVAVQGTSHTVTLTPMAWTIITGLILPFVVAAITKAGSSATFKGVVAIVAAAVAALVERATLADGSALFSTGLLLDIGLVYVPQLMTYLGVWQHVDLNAKIAPTKGLGA